MSDRVEALEQFLSGLIVSEHWNGAVDAFEKLTPIVSGETAPTLAVLSLILESVARATMPEDVRRAWDNVHSRLLAEVQDRNIIIEKRGELRARPN